MTPRHSEDDGFGNAQPGLDWSNLILGGFLAFSPWLLLGDGFAATVNAVLSGAVIAVAAGISMSKPSVAAQWVNLGFGVWLFVAPWLLGFYDSTAAMWTSLLVGLGVAGFASAQLSGMTRSPTS